MAGRSQLNFHHLAEEKETEPVKRYTEQNEACYKEFQNTNTIAYMKNDTVFNGPGPFYKHVL